MSLQVCISDVVKCRSGSGQSVGELGLDRRDWLAVLQRVQRAVPRGLSAKSRQKIAGLGGVEAHRSASAS